MPLHSPDLLPLQNLDRDHAPHLDNGNYNTSDDEEDAMTPWDIAARPGMVTRAASEGRSAQPLLEESGLQRGRGETSYEGTGEVEARARRRHEMRSRSPSGAAAE